MYKAKKILSSVIIALLVITSVFGIIGVGYYTDWFSDFEKSESEVLSSGGLVVTVDEEHNDEVIQTGSGIFIDTVRLSSNAELSEDVPDYLQKNISATIYPSSSVNKTVDWWVEWGENPKDADVTDYLTIIPEFDGSLNAVITCQNNFAGSTIFVFCQIRDTQILSSALCSYVGMPYQIDVECVGAPIVSHDTIGEYYSLIPGQEYTFNFIIYDIFGVEIADKNCNFEKSRNEVGSFYVQTQKFDSSTGEYSFTGEVSEKELSSIRELNPVTSSVMSVYNENSGIRIMINGALQDFYISSDRVGQIQTRYSHFKEFVDDDWYYEYIITETFSNATCSFKFRIEDVPSSVLLSDSTIEF